MTLTFYREKQLKEDLYLIPYTFMELSQLTLALNDNQQARMFLDKARYDTVFVKFVYKVHLKTWVSPVACGLS